MCVAVIKTQYLRNGVGNVNLKGYPIVLYKHNLELFTGWNSPHLNAVGNEIMYVQMSSC